MRKMKVIIAGSTGMVGGLILKNCIASDSIKEVIVLARKPGQKSADKKVKEVVITDFANYSDQSALFQNVDAAFFCIGVYTGQVPDDKFKIITVDYAVEFAKALKINSPNATLCLLSGAGADRTEKSRTSFARYKGMAENQISRLNLKFFTFRPGYIYPVTPRKEPSVVYQITRALYPLIKLLGSNTSIKSTELANAMFKAGLQGADKEILENRDILNLL
ncbi:MAG: NAD(P)H-binding protein [Bacteroidota bacterium]